MLGGCPGLGVLALGLCGALVPCLLADSLPAALPWAFRMGAGSRKDQLIVRRLEISGPCPTSRREEGQEVEFDDQWLMIESIASSTPPNPLNNRVQGASGLMDTSKCSQEVCPERPTTLHRLHLFQVYAELWSLQQTSKSSTLPICELESSQ